MAALPQLIFDPWRRRRNCRSPWVFLFKKQGFQEASFLLCENQGFFMFLFHKNYQKEKSLKKVF